MDSNTSCIKGLVVRSRQLLYYQKSQENEMVIAWVALFSKVIQELFELLKLELLRTAMVLRPWRTSEDDKWYDKREKAPGYMLFAETGSSNGLRPISLLRKIVEQPGSRTNGCDSPGLTTAEQWVYKTGDSSKPVQSAHYMCLFGLYSRWFS